MENMGKINDIEVEALLTAIKRHYGYDFHEYAKSSLKRRINHRLTVSKLDSISEMQSRILTNKDFFNEFLRDMSVTVTEMFRDPFVYAAIRNTVIPALKTYPFAKIWMAGCATGEEVYSLAIMLHEEKFLDKTHIYATDYNRNSLNIAHEGVYSLENIEKAEKRYYQSGGKGTYADYFHAKYRSAKMKSFLMKRVTFSHHNLVCDGVFGEMNFIICRNVLIYFNGKLQDKVLSLFNDSLIRKGYLCLGTKESIQFSSIDAHYEVLDPKAKIYQQKMRF